MAIWEITSKDLSLLVRDRRTLAVLLALPMVFIAIIGLTSGKFMGLQNSNRQLKIVVLDEVDYAGIGTEAFWKSDDSTPGRFIVTSGRMREHPSWEADQQEHHRRQARNLIVKIVNQLQQQDGVTVMTLNNWCRRLEIEHDKNSPTDDRKLVAELLKDERVNAALLFGDRFYEMIYQRASHPQIMGAADSIVAPADIDLHVSTAGAASHHTAALNALVTLAMLRELTPVMTCLSRGNRTAPPFQQVSTSQAVQGDPCLSLAAQTNGPALKLEPPAIEDQSATQEEIYNDIVPSYTVMFVFFLVNIMARSFLHERDLGTLRRLQMAPISGLSILIGKTLPFLIISLSQTSLLLIAGRLLFGMSWGTNPWLLLPVIFCTSLAATTLGLMVATLIKSDAQVSAYATSAVIILAGVSGCFMPRKWMPDVMQQFSLGTPHAWSLIAYEEILSDATPDPQFVLSCCGMLLLFCAAFILIGAWRFRPASY
ncbi:ABC transporter permease [Calycomorphotria hydatis]|uniref:ABC-2 family transporter protein n=1 Tax=Calycomorphotria hydatis TaxID=2528027 RepID=A0A517TBC0_9PLAN|nr:ABC transporter permease [Calycomorphotria hydatis]QDT65670.1 ABC-2 family transporter protein [Calycomorphotria hydatis]